METRMCIQGEFLIAIGDSDILVVRNFEWRSGADKAKRIQIPFRCDAFTTGSTTGSIKNDYVILWQRGGNDLFCVNLQKEEAKTIAFPHLVVDVIFGKGRIFVYTGEEIKIFDRSLLP